jgi:hypothetical protein
MQTDILIPTYNRLRELKASLLESTTANCNIKIAAEPMGLEYSDIIDSLSHKNIRIYQNLFRKGIYFNQLSLPFISTAEKVIFLGDDDKISIHNKNLLHNSFSSIEIKNQNQSVTGLHLKSILKWICQIRSGVLRSMLYYLFPSSLGKQNLMYSCFCRRDLMIAIEELKLREYPKYMNMDELLIFRFLQREKITFLEQYKYIKFEGNKKDYDTTTQSKSRLGFFYYDLYSFLDYVLNSRTLFDKLQLLILLPLRLFFSFLAKIYLRFLNNDS